MFLKVLVTLGFSLNFILAVRTEETVIKHKLAKDTLREMKNSSSYREFEANNQK